MTDLSSSVAVCVSRALVLLKNDTRTPRSPARSTRAGAASALAASGATASTANASGVCAYAATPAVALHGVAQLLDAAAPYADSDAQHALVAVVVAALLDTEQVRSCWSRCRLLSPVATHART